MYLYPGIVLNLWIHESNLGCSSTEEKRNKEREANRLREAEAEARDPEGGGEEERKGRRYE